MGFNLEQTHGRLPDPFCGFRPGFGLAEGQVVIAEYHRVVPAVRATPFGDTPCDSHPAGPVHEGVRHGVSPILGVLLLM